MVDTGFNCRSVAQVAGRESRFGSASVVDAELSKLEVGNIYSQRMVLRVRQGKGRKDRYAMLSPALLERLGTWCAWPVCPGQDARRRLVAPGSEPH